MIDFIDYSDPYVTVIDKSTTVNANIRTMSSIEIAGVVIGNVEAEGLTSVYGKIEGNVSSKDLIARESCSIIGDISLIYDGKISTNSKIQGNINCKNIEIFGNVVGDIKAESSVVIRNSANVLGDITCHSLIVDEGARINGNVKLLYQLER